MTIQSLIGTKKTRLELIQSFHLENDFELDEFLSENFIEICDCGTLKQESTCVVEENKPCANCEK
jgi:hypothetical protein